MTLDEEQQQLFYSRIDLNEFILQEGIRLNTAVKYGLNSPQFDDRKYTSVTVFGATSLMQTIFEVRGTLFVLDYYATGDCMFRVSNFMNDTTEKILTNSQISRKKQDQQLPYTMAALVFGSVLAVMLSLAKQNNISKFHFTGYSPELQKLYTTALEKNRFLRNDLAMLGWTVTTKDGKFYVTKN